MKLRKLTIHNIASIEDAEIDFQAKPLANADVFLISGKTGAGKSTILDCICLALFTSTPRMNLTMMEGKMNDNSDKIGIDNPRQLLRRGTGEGFSRLEFTGNDGVDYEATWTVSRAYNKPTGRLKKALDWEIRNLNNGQVTRSSEENKSIISRALGVDFNQFCRTTMLAQGEFTRFLNSKDSEKAQILEKITGASEYALIGAKVFEIYSKKKNAVDVARQKIADIKILTEEELNDFNSRLNEIANRKEQLNTALDKARSDKNWLTQRFAIEDKIKQADKDAAEARGIIASPEIVALRQTITQWNDTSEIRPALNTIESSRKELEEIEREYASFNSQFATILADRNDIEATRIKTVDESTRLRNHIDKESVNKSVYESAAIIITLTEQIAQQDKLRQFHDRKADELSNILSDKLQPAFDKETKECQDKESTLRKEAKLLADGMAALEALQIKSLRQEHDRLARKKNDIDGALKSFRTWISENNRLETLKNDIKRRETELPQKRKIFDRKQTELNSLMRQRNSLKEVYDNQKNTVDKWAVAMRAKLHVGDVCPVCMQTVTEMPQQEIISQLLNAAEAAFKKAESDCEHLAEDLNKLAAEINVTIESISRDKKTASDTTILNSIANDVSSLVSKAFGQDAVIPLSDETENILKNEIDQTDKLLATCEGKLKEASASEEAVTQQRKKVDTLREELEKGQRIIDGLRTKVAEAKMEHEKSVSLAQSASENIKTSHNKISDILKGSNYEGASTNLETLCKEISDKATEFNAATEKLQITTSDLNDLDRLLSKVNAGIELIVRMYAPLSTTVASSATRGVRNTEESINQLRSGIQSASDRLQLALNRKKESETKLGIFLESHSDISIDRLKELATLSPQNIKKITEQVNRATERVKECETILQQLRNQLEGIIGQEPAGIADTTIEKLTESIDAYELQSRQLDETTGSIRQQLADNATNMRKRTSQIGTVNQLLDQLSPWEKLNALIGDATGSKFRKIAQSYVLAALIHSANHYMSSLSDRYRLKVEPGTFIISIEDAYQGYVCRPCTTISGGESFLVSLALALALSDIGDRVASDTIFIDEGFGTLSGEYLRKAIDTLRTLHSKAGRHVGIISHVEDLREQIPVQILVERHSQNSSGTVKILG